MALLGSKTHTVGDIKRWTVNYEEWLDNAATIMTIDVLSDSDTCTIDSPSVSGPNVIFFLVGGELNERVMIELTMTDSFGNTKHDTIAFTVVAP